MPSRYPVLPPSDIIRAISKKGFIKIGQRGSHMKFSDGIHVVIIPNHKEIAKGTLKSILDMSGITLEDFLELL